MSPAANEAALLVIEVGEFHLQPPLGRSRSLPENLEDQAGAVDHFALQPVFQIALLNGRKRAIHHNQVSIFLFAPNGYAVDLTGTEQRAWLAVADRQDERIGNDYADRQRQPARFFQPRLRFEIVACSANIRANDYRPRTARNFAKQVVIEAQSSSPSQSSLKSTCVAG